MLTADSAITAVRHLNNILITNSAAHQKQTALGAIKVFFAEHVTEKMDTLPANRRIVANAPTKYGLFLKS